MPESHIQGPRFMGCMGCLEEQLGDAQNLEHLLLSASPERVILR